MKILVVGSGGREHAIGWKIAQSPQVEQLFFAPGNPGTADLGINLAVNSDDIPGLVRAAQNQGIDLVVVGPEVPLTMGVVNALRSAGIRTFGPTKAAAQIEGSKVFAKDFMDRHGIPSAEYACFTDFQKAVEYLDNAPGEIVIKASGLAAGKGVILPGSAQEAVDAVYDMLVKDSFGEAGQTIVIEERLQGEEVSLLGFSDGLTVKAMPPAQDHKRLLDGDRGPNTGGMGAYAPAPVCPPELAEQIVKNILQPTIDGLRGEGMPFVGVLYAGLILTEDGPKLLEYNCRFGDPETQVILPLLETDLVTILDACTQGKLNETDIHWRAQSCACVVIASGNYPQSGSSGLPISGLDQPGEDTVIFQAGTRRVENQIATSGGRVLGITAWAGDLTQALEKAYAAAGRVHFQGMQYRKDIGQRAIQRLSNPQNNITYAQSGVSIDAGNRAVALMTGEVRSTYTPSVLAGIGAFGGLFDASQLKTFIRPVLVASTDGVGTKVKLAAQSNRYQAIGQDIVNHCINDILVQGARPLFFLDYFATSALKPEVTAEIVTGMAAACREAGCVLLGGETAEMPGVYAPGEFDVAGTIVGLVEYERILPRLDIQAGDLLVGLPSSGPHTNGFSLIRQIFGDENLESDYPELGGSLAEALLAPHRSYLSWMLPVFGLDPSPVKALAHLTGGGFIENIPRILPEGLGAVVHWGTWMIPPLFKLIQSQGNIAWDEMARVFNLGIGMVAVVLPGDLNRFQAALPQPGMVIGEIVPGRKQVTLV